MRPILATLALLAIMVAPETATAAGGESPRSIRHVTAPPAPPGQTWEQAAGKSAGCVTCHTAMDNKTMHINEGVVLGCTDCHGGNIKASRPAGTDPGHPAYDRVRDDAHVQPRYPKTWNHPSSANPVRSYALLNKEAPEYIRFVNPGDYRIAREACGACHLDIIQAAERSLMATGAMLWGGAAYNNGILPFKNYITGEGYTRDGQPAKLLAPVTPTPEQTRDRGLLPSLLPLPMWTVIPPGDIFRVFERGGRNIVTQFPEIGNPNNLGQLQRLEEPGRPDIRQSNRGPGTGIRIAVPVINIHKTRLNDPFTWFLGTNDQPGDYRSSGCSSCHVIYANDRDPRHSGLYAKYGHEGKSQSVDPTIPKDRSGHPLWHMFTSAIPTSQCMICHMHQPNIFLNSMLGYTMWDYESDAPAMWPEKQKYPSNAEMFDILSRNPEEAAIRGKWGDVEFLKKVWELNPTLEHTQFADYHGHGWNFRAIFKRDRKGNLLDAVGGLVANNDPEKFKKAVHMSSIHVDIGMHCVDCHFHQDGHGNGHIYGEVAAAIEITCADCHGTVDKYPTLRTSGPAARPGGNDLSLMRLSNGQPRFEWRDGKLIQRASLDPGKEWVMSLVKDTVDPSHPEYNAKAARAKLMGKGKDQPWGPGVAVADRAHKDDEMACFTCHLSWSTSCGGCHLPIQANWKTEMHHFEGGESRNYATYNPQVARDEMFHLGRHGTIKGGIVAPIRSTSALILSSTNINREIIYAHQPPIAASGYSSQAFAPHYPHTERKTETKTCSDCHLSDKNDNNAWMAQLLLHGTNFVNFVGYHLYTGEERGVRAVRVTEWEEPQAVIGSYLHRYAYPDWFKAHQDRGQRLQHSEANGTGNPASCVFQRGEYLLASEGRGGTRAYDIASVANKGVSQKILTGPFGPFGHDLHLPSRNATCVALPTNQPIHPPRNQGDLMRVTNQEQAMHPIYSYALITDAEEGLIVTNVETLSDGDPQNNFLKRDATWNEGGVLKGARHLTIAGTIVYVAADAGVVILDLDDPLKPKLVGTLAIQGARATAVQFRYLFVTTSRGLEIADITVPQRASMVPGAIVPLADAHRVYVARTYAYVAAGADGLVMVDVENPEKPWIYERFTADGRMNDARDVIVATTNATAYAYVADGRNGVKVIHLTAPDRQPNFYGFTPEPKPLLIAWYPTPSPSIALSKGLDRDRGVDETGHQIAIFGRIGARPFTLAEQRKLYLDDELRPWFVTDEVRANDFRPGASARAPAPTVRPLPPPRVTPSSNAMPSPDRRRLGAELR
jgi:hypothetical protein